MGWLVPSYSAKALMEEVEKHSDRLDELVVRGNGFTNLDPHLISSCLNRLKRVVLDKTRLSREQAKMLFDDMANGTSILELDIRENDLCRIDANVLAACVEKLKKTTLIKTNLSRYQKETLLEVLESRDMLENLHFRNGRLQHLGFRFKVQHQ